jgi:flagellar biosynthesis protein FlhG
VTKEDYSKYYEILELDKGATLSDVKRAYLHLKELYSTESIVTSPIIDEFPDDNRNEILDLIEDARRKLTELFEKGEYDKEVAGEAGSVSVGRIDSEFENVESFTGEVLSQIRERLGIEISDIAIATKIRATYIESIELEKFDALPPAVYTRGFVVDYARFLQLDSDKVAKDYMELYKKWEESKS